MTSRRTTAALGLVLVTTLAGQSADAAPDATSHAYQGPAVGAYAMYDGTWAEPGADWREALTASGPTVPAGPEAAQDDRPHYYGVDGCHASQSQTTVDPCPLGDPDGEETWLVLGSSKSGTWVDPLDQIAERHDVRLEVGTRSATPWTPGHGAGTGRTYNDAALDYVDRTNPDVLFLVADANDLSSSDWEGIVDEALAAGAGHVAVLWNPTTTTPNPMTCLENEPADYRDCAYQFVAEGPDPDLADRANRDDSVSYLSVQDWVAPEGTAYMVIGDVITRGSGSHLTSSYVDTLELPLQSELFESGLVDTDPDDVTRIAGVDRYGTAAQLATLSQGSATTTYVASGLDYPDALAAAAVAGGSDRLVLTRPGSLPGATQDAITALVTGTGSHAAVVGGTTVVTTTVTGQLDAMGVWDVERIAGTDRYETAARVAADALAGQDVDRVYLASGEGFPDALAAASHAGDDDALLLTKEDALPSATAAALEDLDPRKVVIVGGQDVVSQAVEQQVRQVTGTTPVRAAGADRWATAAALFSYSGTALGSDQVIVATGLDFPDALASGQLGAPVVLTKPDQLPSVARSVIARYDAATVVGGTQALSTDVELGIQDLMAD